jgi:hypothetical protein
LFYLQEVAVKKFLDQDFYGDALDEFRSEVGELLSVSILEFTEYTIQCSYLLTPFLAALFDNTDVLYLTRYELCVGCAIQILFSLWELLHALRTYQLYVNIFQGIVLTT